MSQTQQSLLAHIKPLSSRPGRGVCGHCNQALPLIHRHTLCRGLVSALWKLYHIGKPIRLGEIGLTTTEFNNTNKLAYFGLAQSVDGCWAVTERGLLFLANRLEVSKRVWTRSGKVVESDAEMIKVSDVDETWETRLEFAREARRA